MKYIITILFIALMFIACGDKSSEAEASTEAHADSVHEEHDEAEQTNTTLTEDQIKTVGIQFGTVEMKNLKTSIKANGTLTVPNQNKAFVTSIGNGVLNTLLIQPGSFIEKGQIIATIINPDLARSQQDLQSINAQIGLAEIELRRQKELVEGNAAPLKNIQRVQTELTTLRATRNALQKQLTALGISTASVNKGEITTTIEIVAPISGTVSTVSAQIGSSVNQATPIAEIVNNSQLHLDLFVYEKDLSKLQPDQIIHFTLTNNPGREYDAKIFSIGTAFATETKTIPVHAIVQGDKSGLIEGMNVTAVISIGNDVVPSVPTEAIVSFQGQEYVFMKSAKPVGDAHARNEKPDSEHGDEASYAFERVQVIKGTADVGYTEVKFAKDIPPQSQIVVKGAFFVLAKMSNTGGHDH